MQFNPEFSSSSSTFDLELSSRGNLPVGDKYINRNGEYDIASFAFATVNVPSTGTADHSELENLDYASAGHTGFQPTITDLDTIRAGAALGATALQEHQSLAAYRTSAAQDAIDDAIDERIDETVEDISIIEEKIPAQATVQNKLADKQFVNSSIATNTANFRGTFNSVAELEAYSGEKTNNDYAFVIIYDPIVTTEVLAYDRYKYNGTAWVFEYELNNSSFTAEQWAAIQSGITSIKISGYDSHLANTDIHITSSERTAWNAKYVKPSGGIPASDMAQSVQTSLSKADTALQAQDITSKEDTSNKVTSLSASSTNAEYPSAKCVYDLIGNLETLLEGVL